MARVCAVKRGQAGVRYGCSRSDEPLRERSPAF
jgi:hypothetical protein